MRTYKTEAIVIKRRNVGEADRILTIFTKDQGKCIVKAKGIRRIPSRRSAHVELLNNSILTLYQAQRSPILVEAVSLNTYDALKQDLGKIGFAYHICELVDGLCPENQENKSVFFLLQSILERLSHCVDPLLTIHEFEIELLTLLGYWHKPLEVSANIDTQSFIENILERRLKSRLVFAHIESPF
jgi:DNA repair protein RecO (recombination protein O)